MKKLFTITLLAFSLIAIAQNPEGGSLSANPIAQPELVCSGQPVQLLPFASGGSSDYIYSWTSNPPGFTSSSAEPIVIPLTTTEYTVQVADGSSTTSATVTVVVNPLPDIDLLPLNNQDVTILGDSEFSICAFQSIELTVENTGCTYLWSNGSTEPSIQVGTSGITYDTQVHNVTVTNLETGCSEDQTITVHFNFSDCSYGWDENDSNDGFRLYPNPSTDGIFHYSVEGVKEEFIIEVITSQGNIVDRIVSPKTSHSPSRSTINLGYLESGVYFLRVSNQQFITTEKIIIQR